MNLFLNSALTLTYNQLKTVSGANNFWQVFDTSFSNQYNRSAAEILRLQWKKGDFTQLPQIEILSSSILGNANGAYATSTNRIYLSDTFVANATTTALSAVLLEEIGHFVDAHINQTDSSGDEGKIFADLVQGKTLDVATLQQLKAENDQATITLNGQTIQVENSTPATAWTKLLGGSSYDEAKALTTGSDGAIYVSGYTGSNLDGQSNNGSFDAFITKYLPDGTKSWTKLLGGSSYDEAKALTTGSDGAIYASGFTNSNLDGQTNNGSYDAFITKYLPDGTKSWTKLLGGSNYDVAYALTTGSDGAIYVSGYTSSNLDGQTNNGSYDAFITKYLPDGTKSWTKLLGGSNYDDARSLTTGSDGAIYVSGYTGSNLDGQSNNGSFDAFITKYLPDGTKSWTKLLGGSNYDDARSLTTGSDGAIYVSGYTNSNLDGQTNNGSYDAFITKYLPDGTKSWTKLLGGSNYDVAYALTTGSDGAIYVSGYTSSNLDGQTNNGGGDAFITKYLPDGTKSWTKLLGGSNYDVTYALATVSDGAIYVSGSTLSNLDGQTNNGGLDAFITKLDIAPTIDLSLSPSSVTEDGAANLVYTFTRDITTNALTVNYSIAGTANSSDYTGATPGTGKTITFAANSATAILTIDPTADTTFESDETVALTLVAGTNYTIGTTTAVTGTIINDDLLPSINLSANQTIVEGFTSPQNLGYTVTLSSASDQSITVQYATANGTAIAGADYTSTSGTLTFNPGITSQLINIPILNDDLNEVNETFTVSLTSPTNAVLGTTKTVTTTISDTVTASVTTTLPANVENLTLTGTTAINGTGNAGNNVITGNSANNTLTGLDGNDTYSFVAKTALGTDTIIETTTGGIDTLDFTGTTTAINVNLGVSTLQTVNSNLKLILSANNVIENATGGTGNDRITGNTQNNLLIGGDGNDILQGLGGDDILWGGAGNDLLNGGSGNDSLWGGLGDDILTGGVGNDKYLFQSSSVFATSLGIDYISEFEAGLDQIVLSKTTFNAITDTVGQALTDFAVVTNNDLVDGSAARIVFSQSSGSLFYNQNGAALGATSVFEFAYLGNPDITLNSSDFSLLV
ncbi:MAG: SBBP repeat-containing protein [Dolichospermum sp. DET50]|nr:SBBP repeat-containing protein [Dolichospermum sp. DET66]MBS3035843.1 SBBP repeat-containing protein [Dolichospermum sp. DET67]MBS3041046.1 SBBP repeat-containing protein [Dolichospermum sp. DET50]QSX68140.1 MAG: SBBP repeat-containing protein [Dolichospermum sp. DET69]